MPRVFFDDRDSERIDIGTSYDILFIWVNGPDFFPGHPAESGLCVLTYVSFQPDHLRTLLQKQAWVASLSYNGKMQGVKRSKILLTPPY